MPLFNAQAEQGCDAGIKPDAGSRRNGAANADALLPGGATLTGMIPEGLPDSARDGLLSPEIVVPPLLWLCSDAAAAVTGKRLDARRWMGEQPGSQRTTDTLEDVGC